MHGGSIGCTKMINNKNKIKIMVTILEMKKEWNIKTEIKITEK